MKQKSTVGYILRLALTLLVITGTAAVLLAFVNTETAPRIASIKAQKTLAAISAVLPDADTARALDRFPDETGIVKAVYASDSGYAIEVIPAGFGGELDIMVGVGKDGCILGVSIISQSETPGLGAAAASENAKGQSFREQFVGQCGTLALVRDGGSVEALTSATITSRAVTAGINAALSCAEKLD